MLPELPAGPRSGGILIPAYRRRKKVVFKAKHIRSMPAAVVRTLVFLGLPDIPEGDIAVASEAAARASVGWGSVLEHADTVLRRWPVACLSLLIVAIILGALMFAG